MTFQTIQTHLQLLEASLIQSNTYESVLALKNDIASLIISFNDIERSNIEALEAILAVKNNIRNLRENYRTKIQNLRPACVQREESEGQVEGDYKDVPTRKPKNEPQSYLCNMDENIVGYYVSRPEYSPEPKEDTDSDYKEIIFRKPQYQTAPYIANIPGSDFTRVSQKK